jgi:formate hydrogenlyase subunit 4
MIQRLIENATQLFLLLALAPLVTGVIRTLKARLQTRRGPGILQPYRDLNKLFRKGMVIPATASWIFAATPWVVFFSTILAGMMIPMVAAKAPLGLFGGVLAVIYLLGLGRFFLALSGLDTGSSFGGLGSSREMTISALAEPAMMLAIFTVAIGAGSTGLTEIAGAAIGQTWRFLAPAQMFAFAALALVLIAYSGPYLALVEWAASIKQLVLMTLLINCFWPFGLQPIWFGFGALQGIGWLLAKLLLLSCAIVLLETVNAKMRLFRVPELLAVAFTLGSLALVSTFLF